MSISDVINSYARDITESMDNLIANKYLEMFGVSPFVPGTKVLTSEAQENLKDYEVKLINERYDYQGYTMTYSVEGIDLVKIEEANDVNANPKENPSNMQQLQ